jgi:hypothetical protein
MMLGSDEVLDCITAAMNHSEFFSSCDDEEDESEYRKRSRHSSGSSVNSLGQHDEDIESLCHEAVRVEECELPQLEFSPRPFLKAVRSSSKYKALQAAKSIPCNSISKDEPDQSGNDQLLELAASSTVDAI